MGNSASSGRGHHDETVDFGYLTPQGIYTGPRDWNQGTVTQLIVERKLAPFYRPLEDYEESWDDDQILAARKAPPDADDPDASRADPAPSSSSKGHGKRPSTVKEIPRHYEAALYRGAIECPICFLYYPSNINRSRCCDQAICTECFVQIKRNEPTTTHLVSEPAACPYCVQENFGIVYTPPTWRTGLGSDGSTPPSWPESPQNTSDAAGHASMKRRRKSFGANDPEVVTVDHIHPDWEAKLAAVRAAVARRANRRIIMRQVGDRLIPIGVTSGRVHPMPTEEGSAEASDGDRGSRRSRRRQQQQDLNQFLGSMGLAGQDLEELMVMEAMRLSLLEHEAQQRKQEEEEAKKKRETGTEPKAAVTASDTTSSPGGSSATPSGSTSQTTQENQVPGPAPAPKPITDESRSMSSASAQSAASTPPASGHLTPPNSSTFRRHSRSRSRSGRSTPTSQYGAISAAVLSAASTASALASPEPRGDTPSASAAAPADPTVVAVNPPTSHPVATPVQSSETPAEIHDAATTAHEQSDASGTDVALSVGATSPNGEATGRPELPPAQPSVASSALPSPYDVLPSSPESMVDKPLLDSAVSPSPPPVADGDVPNIAAPTN